MPPASAIVAWVGWTADLVLTIVIILLPVASRAQTPPRALSATELLDMYGRGDAHAAAALLESVPDDRLEALAGAIQKATPAWLKDPDPTVERHRRLAAATLALDLFHAGYETEWAGLRQMIEWGCDLIRRNPAGDAEHLWYLASVAAAAGARDALLLINQPVASAQKGEGSQHLRHARERFPDDPRWRLAEAVAKEFPLMSEGVRDAPGMTDRQAFGLMMGIAGDDSEAARAEEFRRERQRQGDRKQVIDDLTALTAAPAVAAEAHVHLGYQLFLARRPADALQHFTHASGLSSDPYVRYLGFFLAGRVLTVQRQLEAAEISFRHALEAIPDVQSGAEALATVTFLRGDPDSAYGLVERAFAAAPRPPDPWRQYIFGDYRLWSDLIGRLHATLK